MISGKEIFKLIDTYGLPLDIINMELRERGKCFNIVEFVSAAFAAGWKRNRVESMLIFQSKLVDNQEFKEKLNQVLNLFYGN